MPRSCSIHQSVPLHHTDNAHACPNHPYSIKSPYSGAEQPVLARRNHPALAVLNWGMTTSVCPGVAVMAEEFARLFSCRSVRESDILLLRLPPLLGLLLRRPCSLKNKKQVISVTDGRGRPVVPFGDRQVKRSKGLEVCWEGCAGK